MPQSPSTTAAARRRTVPNYRSRWVQFRLLAAVFVVMSILLTIAWWIDPRSLPLPLLGVAGDADVPTKSELAQEDPDTRLAAVSDPLAESAPGPEETIGARERTWRRGWEDQLWTLTEEEERSLHRVLRSARRGEPLHEAHRAAWPSVVAELDEGWEKYLSRAEESLAELPEDERRTWQSVLKDVRRRWDELQAALSALADRLDLNDEQQRMMADFQQLVDLLALQRVRDNTVHRNEERVAWFRLLDRLDAATLEELEEASLGRAGYMQLYQQPDNYRGKLVTVRGTAYLAYSLKAPENEFGIETYYMLWIRPLGGPNSPLVVYSLQMPADFPELFPLAADQSVNRIEEEVEFTGYFFKRYAYRARDDARIAPLVLAKSPRYKARGRAAGSELPSIWLLLAAAGGAALIGAALATTVYRLSTRAENADEQPQEATLSRLKKLETSDQVAPVSERLKQMEAGSTPRT